MIKQNTVTECAFLPLIYCRGYFQGIGIADFLLWLNEHHVGSLVKIDPVHSEIIRFQGDR